MGKLSENIVNTPLDQIAVNPFINYQKFPAIDYIKIYGLGSILFVIRIIPMALFAVLSAVIASIFANFIEILTLIRIPTNYLRKLGKFIVFTFIRISLFFAGFYWIKVIEKRGKTTLNPTIIPIAPHSTYWDMIVMLKLGATIVSRSENSKMFLVGSILKLCEPVYVEREDRDSRIKAAQDIKAKALGGKIMLFPEGTCVNTLTLIQFKMGAFLPGLPVQPVVIKWNGGKYDRTSWVEEGPGIMKVLFYTLGQMWTSCVITKLAPYVPNDDEKREPRLFADNVQKVMCDELGVLQSFYSYDDIMFMGFATEIKMFRSPVCIMLLKICYRIAKEASNQVLPGSALSKRIKAPKLAPIFSPKYLGLGEDFEHIRDVPDFYIPKVFYKSKTKKTVKKNNSNKDSTEKRLPMSGVVRNKFEESQAVPHIALTSAVADQKRYVYEFFATFVEKCINNIEMKEEIRPIESTEDLAKLLGLDEIPNASKIIKSSIFVDFLKAIEFTTYDGPTTLHLLTVLHLCDCRESSLWERMRAAINLLGLQMKSQRTRPESLTHNPEPTLNLHYFKTLLWYSIGLQQFNDHFFIKHDFNFEYIQNNMKRLFKRAVSENASSLE